MAVELALLCDPSSCLRPRALACINVVLRLDHFSDELSADYMTLAHVHIRNIPGVVVQLPEDTNLYQTDNQSSKLPNCRHMARLRPHIQDHCLCLSASRTRFVYCAVTRRTRPIALGTTGDTSFTPSTSAPNWISGLANISRSHYEPPLSPRT